MRVAYFSMSIYLFVSALFLSLPLSVMAVTPPDQVYRGDFRSPDDIFRTGFISWGDNRELLHHVVGVSSRDRNDGLISTTSNFDAMRQIAVDLLIPTDVDETLWIYAIRPGNTFYDINGSLMHANMQQHGTDIRQQSLYAYVTFAWQEEFASLGIIPTQQIEYAQSARRVVHTDGTAEVIISNERVYNNAYVNGAPAINSGYINATQSVEGIPTYYFGDVHRNPVQASFDVDGCSSGNNLRHLPFCKYITYESFKKLVMGKLYFMLIK